MIRSKKNKISSQGSYPSQAAQRSSQGSYQSSPTIQNSNQYKVKFKKYVNNLRDNLRDKLDLYYTLYQTVIYLMKGIGAKYRHTFKTIDSIEKSSKLLNMINNQFYNLSVSFNYKDKDKDKDKDTIKMYQIAFDTNDIKLKDTIYNGSKNNDLKKKLDKTKPYTLGYFPGVIANLAGKSLSSVATGVQKGITGLISFLIIAMAESNEKPIFYGYQDIINEYNDTIINYYKILSDINTELEASNITTEKSFLLNTKERIYHLSFLSWLDACFYLSDNKLLEFRKKLNFKNDKEIYDILSKIYSINYSDQQYRKINELFNIFFPINNADLNLKLEHILILLRICSSIKIIKDNNNNKYFSINCNFIEYRDTLNSLINSNKKLLLNTIKKTDINLIKNLLKIITESTEKGGWISNFNNCSEYSEKINNLQHINNLRILKNILEHKIINYLIEQKNLNGLLFFLKYCNSNIYDNLNYFNCIIRCIEYYNRK